LFSFLSPRSCHSVVIYFYQFLFLCFALFSFPLPPNNLFALAVNWPVQPLIFCIHRFMPHIFNVISADSIFWFTFGLRSFGWRNQTPMQPRLSPQLPHRRSPWVRLSSAVGGQTNVYFEGDAFSTVEKLPESMKMAFPLLKCLKTHYKRHLYHFPTKHAIYCRMLRIQSQWFKGVITRAPAEEHPVFRRRLQFPLGSPAFSLFLFYETTTGPDRLNCKT